MALPQGNIFLYHNIFLAHLAKGQESLCHGAASGVRPASTFSFKRLLLKNHLANFNQIWQETCLGIGIQICSNKGAGPFWGPIGGKIRKKN